MNLANLQSQFKLKPSEECGAQVADAIHAFQQALRKKKKLDAEHRDLHQLLAIAEAVP